MPLTSKMVQAAFLFFVSCDNRRREYLSQCSLQAGTHTRKLTFQQDSHIRSNSSPPSHSRCALLDTLAPSTSCFGRFRCAKNNTQLFLTCYISPLKNILLLVRHCRNKIVVVPGHVFHQSLHLRRVGSAVGLRRNISVPQFFKRTSHKLTSLQHHTLP